MVSCLRKSATQARKRTRSVQTSQSERKYPSSHISNRDHNNKAKYIQPSPLYNKQAERRTVVLHLRHLDIHFLHHHPVTGYNSAVANTHHNPHHPCRDAIFRRHRHHHRRRRRHCCCCRCRLRFGSNRIVLGRPRRYDLAGPRPSYRPRRRCQAVVFGQQRVLTLLLLLLLLLQEESSTRTTPQCHLLAAIKIGHSQYVCEYVFEYVYPMHHPSCGPAFPGRRPRRQSEATAPLTRLPRAELLVEGSSFYSGSSPP